MLVSDDNYSQLIPNTSPLNDNRTVFQGIHQLVLRAKCYNLVQIVLLHFLFWEFHSTPECEKMWKNEWEGNIVYSHGTSNSTGVAIGFLKNLNININEHKNFMR